MSTTKLAITHLMALYNEYFPHSNCGLENPHYGCSLHRNAKLTHMEAELPAVLVICQTEYRGGATPEGLAAVSISLVLLEHLEVIQKHDAIS